jgi:ABC-type nitrate/sulfonate/bicarbonate transport system substrate-binding protein
MHSQKRLAVLVYAVAALLSGWAPASALDEAKVHVNGIASVNASIFQIAEKRGFYKANGIKAVRIVANSQAGIQGLIGGSFDASMILGLGSAAILRGAPLKIVMSFDSRPVYYLYGSKAIKSVNELKGGKRVGVSGLGTNTDQMTREVLAKNGIDSNRDVNIQGTGTGPLRLIALLGGGLDAAIFNSVEALAAKKQGLNELLFYGDYDLDIVSGGVIVRQKALLENRDFMRRFLRGTLQAFYWLKSNQNDAAAMLADNFKLSKSDTLEIIKATLKAYTRDGTVPSEQRERIVDFQRKQLKIEKEVSPDAIYDFGLLNSLNDELHRAGS